MSLAYPCTGTHTDTQLKTVKIKLAKIMLNEKKLDLKGRVLQDFIFMMCPEQGHPWRPKLISVWGPEATAKGGSLSCLI